MTARKATPAWRAVQQRLAAREALHPLYGSVRYAVQRRQLARQAAVEALLVPGLRSVPAAHTGRSVRGPQRERIPAAA